MPYILSERHAKYDLFAATNWTHAPYAFCAATYKASRRLRGRNFWARIKMYTSYTKSVFPNSIKKGRLHRSTGQTFVLRRDSAYRRSYDPLWRPKTLGRSLLMHMYLGISLTRAQEPRVLKLLTIRHLNSELTPSHDHLNSPTFHTHQHHSTFVIASAPRETRPIPILGKCTAPMRNLFLRK